MSRAIHGPSDAMVGPRTVSLDAGGRVLVPGYIDATQAEQLVQQARQG